MLKLFGKRLTYKKQVIHRVEKCQLLIFGVYESWPEIHLKRTIKLLLPLPPPLPLITSTIYYTYSRHFANQPHLIFFMTLGRQILLVPFIS